MNVNLEHLIVLQAQDLELARLRGELAELPKRLKAAETALAGAEAKLAGCRGKLTTEEKLRRAQELEIAGHRTKLERLRRSLDGATSAQQVAAFEHEIAFSEGAIGTLEEQEFASLERTEALDTELSGLLAAVNGATAGLSGEREHSTAIKTANEGTIAGLERERAALRAEITAQWLSSYDRLAKTRGTAVAEAIGNATAGKCSACQMGVRPQRWQDLIGREHTDEIFPCESCGRMLFWDPRRDTPRTWAAGDRLQAAQAGASSSHPSTGGGR